MARGEFAVRVSADITGVITGLADAQNRFRQFSKEVPNAFKKAVPAANTLEAKIKALNDRINVASNVFKRFGLQMRKDLLNLSGIFVRRFTFTVASAIEQAFFRIFQFPVQIAKQIVQVGAQFEDQMNKTAAVASGRGREIGEVFDEVATIARRFGETSVFTAVQVGEAMFELASVGLTVAEMEQAIGAAANFAEAAQTDLMTATDLTTQVMKSFGVSGEELSAISDIMIEAFNTTAVNVSRLVNGMKFAAPAAGALGISFDETITVLAGFIEVTKQGGISGRAMRFMLQALAAPTDKAKAALESLGISLKEINPKFNSLSDIMRRFALSSLDAGDAAEIFGKRAGPVVTAFINNLRINLAAGRDLMEDFKERSRLAIEEGLSANQAEIFRQSLTNQFRILLSVITEIMLKIFFIIEPTLKRILATSINVLRTIKNNWESVEKAAERATIAVKLFGLALAFKGTTKLVGTLTALSLTSERFAKATGAAVGFRNTLKVLGARVVKLGGLFTTLRFALAGLKFLSIVGAVLTFIEVITKAIQIGDGFNRFVEIIKKGFASMGVEIPNLIDAFSQFTTFLAEKLFVIVSRVVGGVIDAFGGLVSFLAMAADKVGLDSLKEQLEGVAESSGILAQDVRDAADETLELSKEQRKAEETARAQAEAQDKLVDRMTQTVRSVDDLRDKEAALVESYNLSIEAGRSHEESLFLIRGEFREVREAADFLNVGLSDQFLALEKSNNELERGKDFWIDSNKETTRVTKTIQEFAREQLLANSTVVTFEESLLEAGRTMGNLQTINREFSGSVREALVREQRKNTKEYLENLMKTRELSEEEYETWTRAISQFDAVLNAIGEEGFENLDPEKQREKIQEAILNPLAEGEEQIIAFAQEWAINMDTIPGAIKVEETKTKARDLFNSVSQEFARSIADMLVKSKGFIDAMNNLMRGLFVDVAFNAMNGFFEAFKSNLEEGEEDNRTTIQKLGQGWDNLKQELTGNSGVFQSIASSWAAINGDIASIAFATFNAIVQFMQGNVVAGIISAAGAIVGVFRKLFGGKSEEQKAAERLANITKSLKSSFDILSGSSDKLVDKIAKQVVELEAAGETYARTIAIVRNLGDIIEEKGINNTEDWTAASGQLVDVILHLSDGVINEADAVNALNDVVPILIENLGDMGAEGVVNMRQLIVATRELGIHIEELDEFVKELINKGVDGFNILGKNLEGLTDNQLAAITASFGILAQEMLDSGLTGQEVVGKLRDFLIAAKEAGIDLGDQFNFLKDLAVKLEEEGIEKMVQRLDAFRMILDSINGLGLITEDTFRLLELSITDAFEQLTGEGLTAEEALFLMIPHMRELMRIAELYGFELDDATQALIDQAREAGFVVEPVETMEDILGDIRDILEDIREGFRRIGIIGEDAMEDIEEAGEDMVDTIGDGIRELGDELDRLGEMGKDLLDRGGDGGTPRPNKNQTGFAHGGVVPPTPTGSMVARVHSGEVIGQPNTIIEAFQKALNDTRGHTIMNGGDTVFAPNIELKIGRRALRQAVKEVMRKGTLDGDIAVNSESVFFFK